MDLRYGKVEQAVASAVVTHHSASTVQRKVVHQQSRQNKSSRSRYSQMQPKNAGTQDKITIQLQVQWLVLAGILLDLIYFILFYNLNNMNNLRF